MKHILVLLLALIAVPASANVTNVSPSPSERNVGLTGGASVVINWRITRTAAGAPFTLQTQAGEFKANGNANIAWAYAPVLSRTFAANSTSVTVAETVVVPPAVLQKALQANNGNFILQRTFTDNNFNTTLTQEFGFHVTGGAGGVLNVSAIQLDFDNGASIATVSVGSNLVARATLDTAGAGRLEAVWEVNDSGSSTGFFRTLRSVVQSAAGQRSVVLTSPPLPTTRTGRMEVRLRVISPAVGFDLPTLIYFVNGTGAGAAPQLPAMSVSAPAAGAVLQADTAFGWQPVNGAAAYVLEFAAPAGDSTPVARMMMGSESSTTLTVFTRGQLADLSTCRWRVIALDAAGQPVAASAYSALRIAH